MLLLHHPHTNYKSVSLSRALLLLVIFPNHTNNHIYTSLIFNKFTYLYIVGFMLLQQVKKLLPLTSSTDQGGKVTPLRSLDVLCSKFKSSKKLSLEYLFFSLYMEVVQSSRVAKNYLLGICFFFHLEVYLHLGDQSLISTTFIKGPL